MPLVIKVVDYNPDDPGWSQEMCEREEQACKAVNGSIWAPELLWASHTDSCSWFVFEALTPDPMNLDDYLASQPELPTETILHIISQLGAALGDLHSSRGMVHNDLKPAQVCLSRKVLSGAAPALGPAPLPSVYLVDYGISCAAGTPVIEHGFGGTLIYMDPHLKSQALVRAALVEDADTGEVALHYKVKSAPDGCYTPAYDFYALGQLLAFVLARGNEALHQKGVLDVLVALLGPLESRPCSHLELQQLLVRARIDCCGEPDAKQNWSSISSLLSSGWFCHYDDEVLSGQESTVMLGVAHSIAAVRSKCDPPQLSCTGAVLAGGGVELAQARSVLRQQQAGFWAVAYMGNKHRVFLEARPAVSYYGSHWKLQRALLLSRPKNLCQVE
ncbi:kinase-like domain-containing protein [Scenedesmus sp. NREL 46B-D3]|nr:kinase-like domain-containing protein [Scenedesmus sp. NREL 46B-D3]